jgi:hypothetical protein
MSGLKEHPVIEAKKAWNRSRISDLQLQHLHDHYHAILEQIDLSPDEFGEATIFHVRMKLMRIDEMIAAREKYK